MNAISATGHSSFPPMADLDPWNWAINARIRSLVVLVDPLDIAAINDLAFEAFRVTVHDRAVIVTV